VVGVVGACVLAQRMLLVLEGSYLDQLTAGSLNPLLNIVSMAHEADKGLGRSEQLPIRLALLLPLGGLALYGYLACLRRRVTARELFGPLFLAAVVLWPPVRPEGGTARFLLPLLPFVFLYLGHGALGLAQWSGPAWGRRIAAGLAATVLLAYGALYARLDFGPLRHGIGRPETQVLFEHIREQTPTDAVIVFSKARALALFTGRRASPAQGPAEDGDLWAHMRRINATHFVVGRPFPETDDFLQQFADRNGDRLQKVFHNNHFTVYRIIDFANARAERSRTDE
jgi:hypothetical protein